MKLYCNWKMAVTKANMDPLLSLLDDAADSVLFAPYIYMDYINSNYRGITLGAQNCSHAANGAFTGEISCSMLKDYNVQYALIGHSERRQYFNESDQTIIAKLQLCRNNDITPILCIGETAQQRDDCAKVLQQQLSVLNGWQTDIIIAYEPVWAIGSGTGATNNDITQAGAIIHNALVKLGLQKYQLLYGGSINGDNCLEIANAGIDGMLVGGASTKPETLVPLLKSFDLC